MKVDISQFLKMASSEVRVGRKGVKINLTPFEIYCEFADVAPIDLDWMIAGRILATSQGSYVRGSAETYAGRKLLKFLEEKQKKK
jgi:hypothetical protein